MSTARARQTAGQIANEPLDPEVITAIQLSPGPGKLHWCLPPGSYKMLLKGEPSYRTSQPPGMADDGMEKSEPQLVGNRLANIFVYDL